MRGASVSVECSARTPWNTVILKQLHCCHRLNVRDHSSNVELAAAGVHPVGMISIFRNCRGRSILLQVSYLLMSLPLEGQNLSTN